MEKPLASVMMITYNHEFYIAKAIEGVLNQKTNFNYELVIGEDCSTDGTRKIVKEYAEQYPNIIRTIMGERNVGAKKNALRTEMACRGKYIAYCDGDDYWHNSKKLQLQVDFLEKNQEYGLIFTDFNCYFEKSKKLIIDYRRIKRKKNPIPSEKTELLKSLLRGELGILTCTLCARNDLLQKYISSHDYKYESEKWENGDTIRWVNLSQQAKVHCIYKSLATHNVLLESKAQSKDPVKKLKFDIKSSQLCFYFAKKYKLPEQELNFHKINILKQNIKLAFLINDKEFAKSFIRKKKLLSFKDKLFYWGTKYKTLHYILIKFIIIRQRYKKEL